MKSLGHDRLMTIEFVDLLSKGACYEMSNIYKL